MEKTFLVCDVQKLILKLDDLKISKSNNLSTLTCCKHPKIQLGRIQRENLLQIMVRINASQSK